MAAFLDTNILFYAFADTSEQSVDKSATAKRLVADLTNRNELIVSAQVLNEFVINALKKAKPALTLAAVTTVIERLSKQIVIPIDASLAQRALARVEQSRISYWDALIVEAALRSGASILYTEDLHPGTRYGNLELRNPFL